MRPSLNQLADIILNNTEGGLKNLNGEAITREQVKDEIVLMRARLILELYPKGVIDIESLIQETSCITIEKRDISECPAAKPCCASKVFFAKIPRLLYFPNFNPVQFIGSARQDIQFTVLQGNEYLYAPYRKYGKKDPSAWVNIDQLWILHEPKTVRDIKARFVLEDPREIGMYACCAYNDDQPFPSPTYLNDMIIGKMVNDYHRYYSMKNPVIASKSPNHPNE